MQFKIINPQKVGVMITEYPECIPNQEILKDMSENGFKFELDGKRISAREIERIRQN